MYHDCCCAGWWAEMKEAGLLKLETAQSRARVQVIGGVGMREEEEEMSDSGRWRGGLGLPNWIPKALESATLHTQKHPQNEWKCCAVVASAAPTNKGLMPSSGLQAAQLHYPEMDKSIWSNYINQWIFRFLWKQMCVLLSSVKYSRMCHCQMNIWTVA